MNDRYLNAFALALAMLFGLRGVLALLGLEPLHTLLLVATAFAACYGLETLGRGGLGGTAPLPAPA